MKTKNTFGTCGHLTMTEIDKTTGERTVVFDEDNVITLEGFSEILKRITFATQDGAISGSYFYNIVLGNDIGNGTLFDPEPAVETMTAANQTVIYSIPNDEITFNYVSSKVFEMACVLNGTTILNTNFPGEVDMRYTSATLRLFNGKAFSYKRFPVRSLSRLVDIEIVWRITLAEKLV